MIILFLKTLLAHVIGDFVLQTDRTVKHIKDNRFKSYHLYLHVAIHFILVWLFTGHFLAALLLACSHFVIDVITKFYCTQAKYKLQVFIADQVLHLLCIAAFVFYFEPYAIAWHKLFSASNYLLLLTLITLTYVSSVIIKFFMKKILVEDIEIPGSPNAGRVIGMLERLFIFGFMVNNFWEGIGFLLAAKSIFRFGDLKENKDIKLTEYILIGTLLSFGLAMLITKIFINLSLIIK